MQHLAALHCKGMQRAEGTRCCSPSSCWVSVSPSTGLGRHCILHGMMHCVLHCVLQGWDPSVPPCPALAAAFSSSLGAVSGSKTSAKVRVDVYSFV